MPGRAAAVRMEYGGGGMRRAVPIGGLAFYTYAAAVAYQEVAAAGCGILPGGIHRGGFSGYADLFAAAQRY